MLREILAVRRTPVILLAVLALADLALLGYLSAWQKPELERAQTEWFAKRDAAARGEDRGASARYQEGERALKEFQGRITDKKEFTSFLSELFALVKGNSLVVKGLAYRPSAVKGDPNLITYGITFGVTGKYAAVKSFLADLARLRKLVTLDAVSLGNTSPTEEQVNLQVQMTVYLKTEGA